MMTDAQFEALLDVFRNIAEEIMFLRDEVSTLRDLYGQVNGFESDLERDERVDKLLKDNKLFDREEDDDE